MTRTEDLDTSTVTSMGTWLKNAERRKRKIQESILNANKLVILQRIARQNSR